MQDYDPVGDRHHCAQHVLHKDHRDVLSLQSAHDLGHLVHLFRRKAGHHLVQQNDSRLGRERADEFKSFARAQGELCCRCVHPAFKPGTLQPDAGKISIPGTLVMSEFECHFHVLQHA